MKEPLSQISAYLKKYKVQELRTLLSLMAHILTLNPDFFIIEQSRKENIVEIIEDNLGCQIPFDINTILNADELQLLDQAEEIDFAGEQALKKLRKPELIDLLSRILDSDVLMEGFCIVCGTDDETLAELMENYGCRGRYEKLRDDSVYRMRRAYCQMMSQYTQAAVNLYGVIHLGELIGLIDNYEPAYMADHAGYQRSEGTYPYTLTFSPEFWCTYTAHQIFGNVAPGVVSTMDGFLTHPCFKEDVQNEHARMISVFKNLNREVNDRDLDAFFSDSQSKYKRLFEEAAPKEMYLPSKEEFLRYADDTYYESCSEEAAFRRFLTKNYRREFTKAGKQGGFTSDEMIDMFLNDLHWEATDADKPEGGHNSPMELVNTMFKSLEHYGIIPEGMDQVNKLLQLTMNLANAVRLWSNHGHTPNELMKMNAGNYRNPGNLTIVPGSSKAARFLEDGRAEIEKMGFRLDLDSNADEIPQLTFPAGINGPVKQTTRKIYPNDPCPCGSGKKYKKCCGRK